VLTQQPNFKHLLESHGEQKSPGLEPWQGGDISVCQKHCAVVVPFPQLALSYSVPDGCIPAAGLEGFWFLNRMLILIMVGIF